MFWQRSYRVVVAINLLTILVQAIFAGQMLGGDDLAVTMHAYTTALIVLITVIHLSLSIVLKAKGVAPSWLIFTNAGLVAAVVLEGLCGRFHYIAIHVPLALAIFGGVLRHLLWSLRQTVSAAVGA